LFDIIQIIYWLALSTWFGGVLFIAMAAPIVVRTVRDNHPILPDILSVNLEGQHGTLLGGTIIGRIMEVLFKIELACAAAMLVTIIAQWIILRPAGGFLVPPLLRSAIYLGAVGLFVYHWRVLWPRMWKYRKEYLDNADNPDIANPALEHLDHLQAESANVLFLLVTLLLGVIVFSANIRPAIVIPAT
jgi:hypothetical protein